MLDELWDIFINIYDVLPLVWLPFARQIILRIVCTKKKTFRTTQRKQNEKQIMCKIHWVHCLWTLLLKCELWVPSTSSNVCLLFDWLCRVVVYTAALNWAPNVSNVLFAEYCMCITIINTTHYFNDFSQNVLWPTAYDVLDIDMVAYNQSPN